ncbi:MAG TPA: FtsX-like permease family protein [Kofleriaceae bacterium]|nr:FtsX-like permease family protein [Kofleriaceae bacterium]
MHILPILSTLRRHRTAATLIVLEIALTCAIVCNAVFLIGERVGRMNQDSGVVENELLRIQLTGIGKDKNPAVLTKEDLAALSAVPGVRKVAQSLQVPFGNSSSNSDISLEKDQLQSNLNASTYFGSENLLQTLGVRLSAGRDFTPDEFLDWDAIQKDSKLKVHSIILSRAVAERLWPGENPLGKSVYMGDDPIRVVGIIERLVRPNNFLAGAGDFELSTVLPIRTPYTVGGNYLLRVDPQRRAEVLTAALAALEKNSPNRIILRKQTFDELRADYFRQDRAMAWLLVSVCAALLIITALGIVGLASFWVQQRTRQIGIRRALGATRRQILRYFQTENFLLATLGIVIGMIMAYGINMLLMEKYELPRLPALFLPLGAVTLWVLGQIAVLGPALRAASVPPAVATRTV